MGDDLSVPAIWIGRRPAIVRISLEHLDTGYQRMVIPRFGLRFLS